jgi:hypothetical protein
MWVRDKRRGDAARRDAGTGRRRDEEMGGGLEVKYG